MRLREVDDERFTAGQTVLDKRIDLQYAANYLITYGYGLDEKSFGFLKKGFCLLLAGKYKEAIDEIRKSERVQPSATVYFIEALIPKNMTMPEMALRFILCKHFFSYGHQKYHCRGRVLYCST